MYAIHKSEADDIHSRISPWEAFLNFYFNIYLFTSRVTSNCLLEISQENEADSPYNLCSKFVL